MGMENFDGFRADHLLGLSPVRKMQFVSFREHDLRSQTASSKPKSQMGELEAYSTHSALGAGHLMTILTGSG